MLYVANNPFMLTAVKLTVLILTVVMLTVFTSIMAPNF
jgi:hypothetical protein